MAALTSPQGFFVKTLTNRTPFVIILPSKVHTTMKTTNTLKRFNTSVRYKEEKSLPWYAYVRDRLTRCDFGSNFETEEQARQWVEWAKETCEKGRKTPEGWVHN